MTVLCDGRSVPVSARTVKVPERPRVGRVRVSPLGLSAVFCAASALLGATGAHAAAHETDVVLRPVRIKGAVAPASSERFRTDFRSGMERGGLVFVGGHPRADCRTANCEMEGPSSEGGALVAELWVDLVRRDYALGARIWSASGELIAEASDTCEICGLEEAAGVVESIAVHLAKQIVVMGSEAPPEIRITSVPSGATILVDGERVGRTPFEGNLSAGGHVVRVQLLGHVVVEREISLVTGVRSTTEFKLDRALDQTTDPRFRAWGVTGVGVGVAILGAAIGLLAIPPQQYKNKCSGRDIDADGDCRYVFDTRWGGASLAFVGTAITTIGVMLLVRTRTRSGKVQSNPAVTVGPTGVGLRAQF